MNFQKSLKDRNDIIRKSYYSYPIVNSIINFHSIYPINRFKINIPENNLHYLEQLELINQINGGYLNPGKNLLALSREYWLLGEVFPFINGNDFSLINPDEIEMIRDNTLKQDSILVNGEPLRGILSLINNKDVYSLRGTSMIEPIISDLMLFYNLNKYCKGLKEVDRCRKNIYKGLFFLKNVSEPDLLRIYTDFRRRIENLFIKIIPEINIDWPDLDMDDLKNHLGE